MCRLTCIRAGRIFIVVNTRFYIRFADGSYLLDETYRRVEVDEAEVQLFRRNALRKGETIRAERVLSEEDK